MREGEEILGIFPEPFRQLWKQVSRQKRDIQEIRLRADKPILVIKKEREYFLTEDGWLTGERRLARTVSFRELEAVMNHVCRYSPYAFEEEMRQGYLTLPGGHRVGIAGQVIMDEGGGIRNIKHIGYLNIRIAHQIIGAAAPVIPYLYQNGRFLSCMLISPPGCGKTTLLRDLVRLISDGNEYGEGRSVGVVDERSEIAGSYMGVAQNDVGVRTDVLDSCPKVLGMMMLIRSMAPKVVAVDEIGGIEDAEALLQVLRCGSQLVTSIHGNHMEEIRGKGFLRKLLRQNVFKRFVVLDKKDGLCRIEGIYDEKGRRC